ncbi:MAG TPA: UDP-3-O-(3-hydroxymyristoyl)glucosamine N-acyltransferase [Kiritimatiellia bacterium]|nr:UDP-3-O-(3-hydroxymyristoyl)glucosamine N-acyltransferase [Kiritimatiellia bacterium]HQQ04405.1 UDP-3-O-(3-hydroxymyristoyl)glucosamine N-acyltransferase [Kiritimatiellia bacterium]
MKRTVREIASAVGGEISGDPDIEIRGLAGLKDAGPGDITFIANPRYAGMVAETNASAVLVPRTWTEPAAAALIRVDDPDKAFTLTAEFFAPPPVAPPPGIHPTAVVAPDAVIGAGASIGPHCIVEPGARIGARAVIFGGCYIGHDVKIGDDLRMYPHVSVRERCVIGHRAIIHNGVVIGSDGFGYNVDRNGVRTKIPQTGIVTIGDDVEIGANTAIDRARFGVTRIGSGVKIDNLVQVAHNVEIGDHAVVVAQVGISGSSSVGRHAVLAGQVGVVGHVHIGDGAIVGGKSVVTKDIPPRTFVSGNPAGPHKEEQRLQALTRKLPEMKQKIADIEKRLQELEKKRS